MKKLIFAVLVAASGCVSDNSENVNAFTGVGSSALYADSESDQGEAFVVHVDSLTLFRGHLFYGDDYVNVDYRINASELLNEKEEILMRLNGDTVSIEYGDNLNF